MKKIKSYAPILSLLFVFVLTLLLTISCSKSKPSDTSTDDADTSDTVCSHEITEWIIDKSASCTEEGAKHKACVTCQKSLEEAVIPPITHTEEILPGKSATCTEAGLTDGKKCSVCQTVLLKQEEISPITHTEVILVGKNPSCTETGLTDGKKCSACNTVLIEQQTIAKFEHSESDWIIDQAATIGVDGSKHKACIRCNETLRTETIPAINENHIHEGKTWFTQTPATCAQTGIKALVCDCGHILETQTVDAIDHTEQTLIGINATCTSTGLTEGKKCAICDKILVKQTVTAKAPHTEIKVPGVSATCTQSGTTDGKSCAACSTVIASHLAIPPTGHSFEAGSCKQCGICEPYGLWIVDGQGNPLNDIIVKVMKGNEQVKIYPYQGEFLSMDLAAGTYKIVLDLSQLSEEYSYDESLCELSPEHKTATIRLFKSVLGETTIFVGNPISADYPAYYIREGATKVALKPNDYTFFLFRPSVAAVYTITYECESDLAISYHGGSFFVQGVDLTDTSSDLARYENGISLSVYSGNIGGEYVLGVKSTSATSCVLNIKNVGDPGTKIENAPWTPYLEDEEMVAKQLSMSVSGTYTAIDLTDLSLRAVYNETDGYYHLGTADGPIIFIDLTSDSQFISSIQTICANQRMGTYIYDINGNITEKRSYNELFIQYGMPSSTDTSVDQPIRVPLTEKLAEAIQVFGDKNGWWSPNADVNIFTQALLGAPYNQAYAWLLFCGYYA